jgi:hypothetical protein
MKGEAAADIVAKRLRTGEIAVWDPDSRSLILIDAIASEKVVSARVIRGGEFKALEESLGAIVVLG